MTCEGCGRTIDATGGYVVTLYVEEDEPEKATLCSDTAGCRRAMLEELRRYRPLIEPGKDFLCTVCGRGRK